mmetsp:Transcript_24573/g.40442  ORF Transcript_24573/g.40442 Transcript_24573/m.40442 type:complete len:154 (+) Transcript_24573:83-544(+)|eukprot:CAMPEP_0184658938 /NCGR_PEP_ID=MMETSP0308-20130426/27399_1 /TAXON_ID=38269 /ORGANISM="Gloeochaete witrockiana, Strain SAG 46.84" /LENGTH=153 /DNA_ID=CAMNT_0027098307 /DNA_START=76 /DNA_END=537 /DNA_ORIENTATION=+
MDRTICFTGPVAARIAPTSFFGVAVRDSVCAQTSRRHQTHRSQTSRFVIAASVTEFKAQNGQLIKPLQDFLLVRKSETKKETAGGILMPDSVGDSSSSWSTGEVLATGPRLKDLDVKSGDTILYQPRLPAAYEFENEKLFFVREKDVLGTITK